MLEEHRDYFGVPSTAKAGPLQFLRSAPEADFGFEDGPVTALNLQLLDKGAIVIDGDQLRGGADPYHAGMALGF